jgi:hypothetical protein
VKNGSRKGQLLDAHPRRTYMLALGGLDRSNAGEPHLASYRTMGLRGAVNAVSYFKAEAADTVRPDRLWRIVRLEAESRHEWSFDSLRGTIQSFEPLQHSANASPVPFGTEWRWYLSLVQLASDGFDGEARFPKSKNCWAKGIRSDVRGPRECQSIVAVTGLD